ncbi:hypothetical protein ACHAXA_011264 [Cyclostephanos tholiformis]|uniref:Uncharacterized protein n=1 Tax=Cyclostephanos tholiformis TaxID=382380 RepID=A0ABD3SPR8_9STRA
MSLVPQDPPPPPARRRVIVGRRRRRRQGKVHRLHFAIRANLPVGTTLRVATSSSTSPPTAAIDCDDHDDYDYGIPSGTPTATTSWLDALPPDDRRLLRDSVELYTTPETYPLWRTRRPVVVIDDGGEDRGGGNGGSDEDGGRGTGEATSDDYDDDDEGPRAGGGGWMMLHRYRYVAITPGACVDWSTLGNGEGEEEEGGGGGGYGGGGGGVEDLPPISFEDPPSLRPGRSGGCDGGGRGRPYRTRVVVVSGCECDDDDDEMDLEGEDDDEIVDRWNEGDDPTYRYYARAMAKETILGGGDAAMEERGGGDDRNNLGDNIDGLDPIVEGDESARDSSGGIVIETGQESIYIVCYHLPVILSRDYATSTWSACWSESLISKSELHGVSSTRSTTWIGTVSNVPEDLLADSEEREAIRRLLGGMDCIPVFFFDDNTAGGEKDNLLDLMYLGFCKQVLWPSFHNVDFLDLAMNGWGQRHRDTNRSDPVRACQIAAEEARERKRSESATSIGEAGVVPRSPSHNELGQDQQQRPELQSDWDQKRLDSWWNAYVRVNETFSRVVANLVSGGDIVWVHDYHLALLPRMLREARNEKGVVGTSISNFAADASQSQNARIGRRGDKPVRMVFFIHVPFPTSQVFRELEHGEDLLEGMLHADVIGFHAFDHTRHFLNAAKRILGLTYESLVGGLIGVRYRGAKVVVAVSNVSVEADIIDALLVYPSVAKEAEALRQKHSGRSIVSGIAVAQRLSGVNYTLMAFERLLTDYPVWQSKVVLLQRCLVPGTRRVDEEDTLREVRWLVQRIRNRFGTEVIDYEEQVGSALPIDRRLAIWMSSQVMMHTPVREGLNLCPLEFVYAHKQPADPGVVITSEFSAVGSILNGALRVNPYDIQNFVISIDSALSMSFTERDARRSRDIDFVSTCPSGLWTRNVLRDLHDATSLQSTNMEAVGDRRPDAILAREAELGLQRLDLMALEHAYKKTKSRVIIIDFNGTLVAKEPAGKYLKREILGTSGFKPTHVTTLALQKLCSDPNNTVYVVSGDSQQNLELAVGNVPGLGLAASNGTCFADPGGQERVWQFLDFGIDWDAVKKAAMPIISKFTARTNGSFVKLSHSSIGWSYYSCDPEWGSLQASYLVAELGEALQSFDVRFVALKGIVEVVPRKANKGQIVNKILENCKEVDFVLCMGDDVADEKMFTSVLNFSAGSKSENSYAFNVAVGKKPTNASFYVDDASDVCSILVALGGDKSLLHRKVSRESIISEDFFA